jgi:hypothetical protein
MLTMKPTRLAACLFAATLPQLGCQFIFGINEYETGEGAGAANPSSSGGNAGENAGGSGGRGGNGPGPGSGGGGEGGSGGSCNCTDGDGWTYVSAPLIADLGSEPTSCGGKPRLDLYFGEPELTCSACSAVIDSGSCSSTLTCFDDNNSCTGNQPAPSLSTSCQLIISGIDVVDSCSVSPPTSAGCNPGTSSLQGTAELRQVLSFCQGCSEDCAANVCAVHDEAETVCPEGLTEAYLLRSASAGTATCDECTANPSCLPAFYLAAPFGECDIPASGCVTNVSGAKKAEVSTNCNSNHPEPYAPTFQPGGTQRTVCCSASLDPALDAYRLP